MTHAPTLSLWKSLNISFFNNPFTYSFYFGFLELIGTQHFTYSLNTEADA